MASVETASARQSCTGEDWAVRPLTAIARPPPAARALDLDLELGEQAPQGEEAGEGVATRLALERGELSSGGLEHRVAGGLGPCSWAWHGS